MEILATVIGLIVVAFIVKLFLSEKREKGKPVDGECYWINNIKYSTLDKEN